jgi:membrane-bound ClpP family serine protease
MANKNQISGDDQLPFTKTNYYILIAGFVLIIIGFFLMAGGGSDDPNVFSDAIFSFRRLSLAPILILAGYGVILYAIMKKTVEKQ